MLKFDPKTETQIAELTNTFGMSRTQLLREAIDFLHRAEEYRMPEDFVLVKVPTSPHCTNLNLPKRKK